MKNGIAIPLWRVIIFAAIVYGASITVYSQFESIYRSGGRNHIVQWDFKRHIEMIEGTAEAPYRYRLLTPAMLELFLRVSPIQSNHSYMKLTSYEFNSFIFRLVQNATIFLFTWLFFRSLGIGIAASTLGLGILIYGMNAAFRSSDLSFYTYTQLVLLMLVALLINQKKPLADIMILPLTIIGALNREEAIFFPVMLLVARASPVWPWFPNKRSLFIGILSLLCFFSMYIAIRWFVGPAPYSFGRYGVYPGLVNLKFNILNIKTWIGLAQMYSLLLFAMFFWNKWPPILRRYFIAVGIPWFGVQFVFGAADETRLFLGPIILISIPAILALIERKGGTQQENTPVYYHRSERASNGG